jgi:hypothetical protein
MFMTVAQATTVNYYKILALETGAKVQVLKENDGFVSLLEILDDQTDTLWMIDKDGTAHLAGWR